MRRQELRFPDSYAGAAQEEKGEQVIRALRERGESGIRGTGILPVIGALRERGRFAREERVER